MPDAFLHSFLTLAVFAVLGQFSLDATLEGLDVASGIVQDILLSLYSSLTTLSTPPHPNFTVIIALLVVVVSVTVLSALVCDNLKQVASEDERDGLVSLLGTRSSFYVYNLWRIDRSYPV